MEIWLISFQVWDDLIGSNKVDLYEMPLKECFRGKPQGYQYRFARASVLLVFLLALGSKSSSLSARVSFESTGCTIRLVLCCFFLLCLSLLILPVPLLGLGSKSTSLSPGFCVRRPTQHNKTWQKFDLFSGFLVSFDSLGGWSKCFWVVSCRRQGMLTQEPAPDPKCKLNITSFFTFPHPLDCLICAKDIMIIVLLKMMGGMGRLGVVYLCWGLGGGIGSRYHIFSIFCSVFVLLLIVLSWLVHDNCCVFHWHNN